jgi:FixJ family two-component response regulator
MQAERAVVYIVEDDSSVRRALQRLVRSAGYETRGFSSGGEFLTSEHAFRPGCVVVDLRLPDMHGLEFHRRLTGTDPGLPVIVLTAFGDELTRRDALEHGAVAFLSKPFDDQLLLEAIRVALGGRPS